MASPRRLERVRQLLQEEVGRMVARSGILIPDALVTVVGVTLSPDLLYAVAHISVYPAKSAPAVLATLEENIWNLQQNLNKRLRMRPVPKLRFVIDQSEEEASEIERMIKEVDS
jgi:ribosome-binding factor A